MANVWYEKDIDENYANGFWDVSNELANDLFKDLNELERIDKADTIYNLIKYKYKDKLINLYNGLDMNGEEVLK